MDEERKINLNTASPVVLQRLLVRVLGLNVDEALRLAQSLLDWRQAGESQLRGFYSDEYYSNLLYPFAKKNAPYEVPDEILLVEGMDRNTFLRLWPYVTIYGGGQVNINTASPVVLYALGLEDDVIAKVLAVRRGKDGMDGTGDDYLFRQSFDVAAEVNAVVQLEPQEMRAIDAVNLSGQLTTNSNYFSIQIKASLARSNGAKNALAIYSVGENRILYWKEK